MVLWLETRCALWKGFSWSALLVLLVFFILILYNKAFSFNTALHLFHLSLSILVLSFLPLSTYSSPVLSVDILSFSLSPSSLPFSLYLRLLVLSVPPLSHSFSLAASFLSQCYIIQVLCTSVYLHIYIIYTSGYLLIWPMLPNIRSRDYLASEDGMWRHSPLVREMANKINSYFICPLWSSIWDQNLF